MKRILLLAIVALFTIGSADAKQPKTEKINNIIYMIGDGMGLSHVSMLQMEGKYQPTAFDRAQNIALIKTYSLNNRVTDSGAAGTALASGYKTNNSMIGQLPDGTPVESIITKAKNNNFASGFVVTCYIQHATPAAFFANENSRGNLENICGDFTTRDYDVVFGGGMRYFNDYFKKQNKDAKKELEALGYTLYTDLKSLPTIPAEGKVLGLFADGDLPSAKGGKRGEYLAEATQKALDILTNNAKKNKNKGFVLMVEGSKIDGEGHSRNPEGILAETRDFANAVSVAMDYADSHPGTLVVVAADHETGGLTIPSNKTDFTLPESGIGYAFGTSSHTATMVPVYFYGAGANSIEGILENNELGQKLQDILKLNDK
ncbi:MAG: alkaline phosphatase [Alistipes sp.]|nr:alkaline phosphatase [Alistipes sp.]